MTEGEFNQAAYLRLSELHYACLTAAHEVTNHHLSDGDPEQRPFRDVVDANMDALAAFDLELGLALP